MALTATKRFETVFGNERFHVYNIAFDNSYPTGGEAITPGLFGLNTIHHVIVPGPNGTEFVTWDRANAKLMVFTADGTQASNASDQSAVSVELSVIGI